MGPTADEKHSEMNDSAPLKQHTPASSNPDPDHLHIRVEADDDLQRWAHKFDATPEQIKDAVAAVGDRADDVEMYLKGTRSTSNAEAVKSAQPGVGPGTGQTGAG